MPNPVGGPSGFPGPPVIPAEGTTWTFTKGRWQAVDPSIGYVTIGTAQTVSGAKTLSAVTTSTNTTNASSSTVGAVTVGNGAANGSVAIGGGNVKAGGNNHAFGDSSHSSVVFSATYDKGSVLFLASGTANYWDVNLRPNSGSSSFVSFTENGVADLWSIGCVAGDATLHFSSNRVAPTGTLADKLSITNAGIVTVHATSGTTLVVASTDNATSATVAAVELAGGIAVTKNIIGAMGRGTGITSTATAAGTTTLTATSTELQLFTGVTTQTIQFPAANLFGAGVSVLFTINNQSTGTVTPTRAGADTFQGGGTTDPVLAGASMDYRSNGVSVWMKC